MVAYSITLESLAPEMAEMSRRLRKAILTAKGSSPDPFTVDLTRRAAELLDEVDALEPATAADSLHWMLDDLYDHAQSLHLGAACTLLTEAENLIADADDCRRALAVRREFAF